jgi:hypothetical protein
LLCAGDDEAIEVGTVRAAGRLMELWQADRRLRTYGNDEVTPHPLAAVFRPALRPKNQPQRRKLRRTMRNPG